MHMAIRNERWNLAEKPELYPWSSAKFYETGIDDFGFFNTLYGKVWMRILHCGLSINKLFVSVSRPVRRQAEEQNSPVIHRLHQLNQRMPS